MSVGLFRGISWSYRLLKPASLEFPSRVATSRRARLQHTTRSRFSHYSTRASKSSTLTPSKSSQEPTIPSENPSLPSFNLLQQIRSSRPAVRYTVYAGLGLMATVESTFWLSIIKAKFFPSTSEEEKEKAEQFLESVRGAVAGYKATWMGNYGRYYGGYVWGVGER